MARPKTAVVTIEVENFDGSTTFLKTEALDASGIKSNREGSDSRMRVDFSTYDNESVSSRVYKSGPPVYFHPLGSSFTLDLCLPPLRGGPSSHVYTITQTPPPETTALMEMKPWDQPLVSKYTEEDVWELIEEHGLELVHFFLLDIP